MRFSSTMHCNACAINPPCHAWHAPQSKAASYESELEQFRHQNHVEGSSAAQKLRDKDKRISSLEEEIEAVKDHADGLEKMLRDSRSRVRVWRSRRGVLAEAGACQGGTAGCWYGYWAVRALKGQRNGQVRTDGCAGGTVNPLWAAGLWVDSRPGFRNSTGMCALPCAV